MKETVLCLGRSGQFDLAEPAVARMWLDWLGGLAGCATEKDLALRARLNARTLARFAEGKGGRGAAKTLASLLDLVGLPPWVAAELMHPTIRLVVQVWFGGRPAAAGAAAAALALAASAAWVSSLAGQSRPGDLATPRAGLHPVDARVLIGGLRALGDWPRRDLARQAGIGRETLRLYAEGTLSLEGPAVRSLAAGVGVPAWLVEGVLLSVIEAVRLVAAHPDRGELASHREAFAQAASAWWPATGGGFAAESLRKVAQAIAGLADPAPADREAAEEAWRLIAGRGAAESILLVKSRPELCSWALVERICTASRDAATDSAREAMRLALLALRVARLLRTEALFALQLEGYAFVHIANAWRVLGKLRRADEAFARGLRFWEAGSATRFPLLPGWRVLDLEASLRRDQRRFPEAIVLLDRALTAAPREAWGRILLKKATVFDQQGEPAAAVAVLAEAAPELDPARDPALCCRWRCMMVAALSLLGRFADAFELLPETLALAGVHAGALDHLRLAGVRARIEAGLGHRAEALALLNTVREEFHRRGMAYDYALASLAAGEVLLQEGRHEDVQTLAREMEWIFEQEGIHPEAEKALALFRKAAEGRTATPELAGRVVRFLYKAQHNPELAFAA